jgi:hypothetical protein
MKSSTKKGLGGFFIDEEGEGYRTLPAEETTVKCGASHSKETGFRTLAVSVVTVSVVWAFFNQSSFYL